ncbi:MAG: methyltransferase domain-containing protein [Rubrobacter sp.]|nr:methyltransferase domain-containing protein [Rubrobacter sp.]
MDGKTRSLNEDTRELWDAKASFWDENMGDGNLFQNTLIAPATERLLGVEPGKRVLEIACGNGVMSRRLAALGTNVVATDFSEAFLERAKARGTENIEYRLVDATSEAELLALGEGRFDAAVCNMALMNMADIEPLLRSLARLLAPNGRFVFSVQHPCFNSNAMTMLAEMEDEEGELSTNYSVKLSGYLDVTPGKGAGMPGEPNPHYYFHRPLHELFGACFDAGFVMDAVEEPSLGDEPEDGGALSWRNLTGIPPVLVARMRLV